MKNKKVGVLTWHYYSNFGSALQAFALQHTIERLDYKVSFVNYHNSKFGKVSQIKDDIRLILGRTIGKVPLKIVDRFRYATICFSHKYHHLGRITTDEKLLPMLTKDYDVLVCGSDQIWAPNVFNPVYFAAFAEKHIRKISYAASIGLNTIPEDLIPKYKELLQPFYAIGIREEEGKNLLKKSCNIDSTVVLDPTLLVDVSVYEKMQRKVQGIHKPFLFCYFLNKEHKYKENVERYAYEHNLQIVGVSDKASDSDWMIRLTGLGADHFLWLINNAETIMTDSYHGSIFSLLFHKSLWIFQRFEESNPICQNSRIRQLSNNFDLGHRIITATSQIDESTVIDYEYFESRLKELRSSSIDFLKKALE